MSRLNGKLFAAATGALGLLLCGSASAQPLAFFKNYIISGDYVVGGVGLRGKGDATGYAQGTISIPDDFQNSKAGLPAGSNAVPAGSEIVAAILYWQSVEKSQSALAGQNGFFNNHPLQGKMLGNPNSPVSWSGGGCAGASNGTTTLRTYRADVRPLLNVDSKGVPIANDSWPVRLADSGSNGGGAPLTLGATLVMIYRVPSSPNPVLRAISIYDGAYAPGNQTQGASQTIQFYDAVGGAAAGRLTHIVGNGQANKSETVSFSSGVLNQNLQSLYTGLPPFPGIYNGSWDNPTWTNLSFNKADASGTTSVTPASTNSGCVSWSSIILSTPVEDKDKDDLLDSWESAQGYTDIGTGSWVNLPGADSGTGAGTQDIYIQVDYLKSGTHSHLPKQAALDMVGDAFWKQGIYVHFDVGSTYNDPKSSPPTGLQAGSGTADRYIIQGGVGGNAIDETIAPTTCTDQPATANTPAKYCEFPGTPTTGWKGGFEILKRPNFQKIRNAAYHEVIFGHALGFAANNWAISDGTLTSIVVGADGTATVTTAAPHSVANGDRVTVSGAVAPPVPSTSTVNTVAYPDFTLNGTYIVTGTSTYTFTFAIPANLPAGATVPSGTYNRAGLFVSSGPALSTSGWSDLRGADTFVTLGLWHWDDAAGCAADPTAVLGAGQVYCNDQVGTTLVQAGTLMHELGHTLGLHHGGVEISSGTIDDLNCKPNFQSVMNYLFQVRGLTGGVVDYSGQILPNLDESSLTESTGLGATPAYGTTRWYGPPGFLDTLLGGTRYARRHCDGTPISDNAQVVRIEAGPNAFGAMDWNNNGITDAAPPTYAQDLNFNNNKFNSGLGSFDLPYAGHSDWGNLDLQQIGARRGIFGFSVGVWGSVDDGAGGSVDDGAGGSVDDGAGGSVDDGAAGSVDDGAAGSVDDGAAGHESDFNRANNTVDSPLAVIAKQSAHNVIVTWNPPGFGQIRTYTIWRANTTAGPISKTNLPSKVGTVSISDSGPFLQSYSFTDTSVKNNTTYTYFVSAALGSSSGKENNGNQSGPSNTSTVAVKF